MKYLNSLMNISWIFLARAFVPPSNPVDQTRYLKQLESQSVRNTRIRIRQIGKSPSERRRYINPIVDRWSRDDESSQQQRNSTIMFPIPVPILRAHFNGSRSAFFSSSRNTMDDSSETNQFVLEKVDKSYNFSRVGGYNELKKELYQIMDFVLEPSKYTKYGLRLPRGILLEGPTGNGKTLIAKCLAGETDMNFVTCSGSEFIEKYVGVGASRVRELFRFIIKNQPCILFIDEIDALGQMRGNDAEASHSERDQTLNQLLVLMDGFHGKDDKILIIGATNRPDILDKALLRPGRFDKIIHVPNPDTLTRKEILQIHWHKKPLNVSLDYMTRATAGFNGAQIENLLNEATLTALRNNSLPVQDYHIDNAKERQILGLSSNSYRNISEATYTRIAIHEIGHLFMAMQSDTYDKPWKVTIDSVNPKNSLGYTIFESEDVDQGFFLREYLEQKISVLLGGRAAEEVFYGQSVSSGALSDLEHAFVLAKKMIMEYGMGKEIIYPYFSETYKKRIDHEMNMMLLMKYRDTKNLIMENRDWMEFFVEKLLVHRTLFWEDIQSLQKEFYDSKSVLYQ